MELRQRFPLKDVLCALGLAKTSFYYWKKALTRKDKDAGIKAEIKEIYNSNGGNFGYRPITLELRNRGIAINHKKVQRLMREMGLRGKTKRKKYSSFKGEGDKKIANLLLAEKEGKDGKIETVRNFGTTGVNQLWGTDVTEFSIGAGKLYLSPIIDAYNGEIVAYDVSRSADYRQIKRMLNSVFERFGDEELEGVILHSDQGWQYHMKDYQKQLAEHGMIQSMSRKGNCLDNGFTESFFGRMKTEMFYGHENEFETLDELKKAIEDYIAYYNEKRIKVKLKGMTPLQARIHALS